MRFQTGKTDKAFSEILTRITIGFTANFPGKISG